MFAMLHGSWPRPTGVEGVPDDALERAVRAQLDAGLDLITDPLLPWLGVDALGEAVADGDPAAVVRGAWTRTAATAFALGDTTDDRRPTVAAVLTGPYTLATRGSAAADVVQVGTRLNEAIVALAAAGCPLVVVDEPAAVEIGEDADARDIFRAAQRALLGDEPGLHAMLAITGGSAWAAGAETILDAPYASYLLDLIAGPDNWYLARAVPGDRGIVCAALRAPSHSDQAPALVWAARYAASIKGRGMERVGLANASPLGGLDEADATRALTDLARAARLAALSPDEAVAAGLDRRTFGQPPERGARPRLPRA
jgi:hypothetical protein